MRFLNIIPFKFKNNIYFYFPKGSIILSKTPESFRDLSLSIHVNIVEKNLILKISKFYFYDLLFNWLESKSWNF